MTKPNATTPRGRYGKFSFAEVEGPRIDELEDEFPGGWLRLCRLVKLASESNDDGALYHSGGRPWTPTQLVRRLGWDAKTIDTFMARLVDLDFLHLDDEGIHWFTSWDEFFGKPRETAEAVGARVKAFRERKRQTQNAPEKAPKSLPEHVTQCNASETQPSFFCNEDVTHGNAPSRVESRTVDHTTVQETTGEETLARVREATDSYPLSPPPVPPAKSQRVPLENTSSDFLPRIRTCWRALAESTGDKRKRMPDPELIALNRRLVKGRWAEYQYDHDTQATAIELGVYRTLDAYGRGKIANDNLWHYSLTKAEDCLLEASAHVKARNAARLAGRPVPELPVLAAPIAASG